MRTEYRPVLVCTDECKQHATDDDVDPEHRRHVGGKLEGPFLTTAEATSFAHRARTRAWGLEHLVEIEQRQVSDWEVRS